jgi:hypothetical protein
MLTSIQKTNNTITSNWKKFPAGSPLAQDVLIGNGVDTPNDDTGIDAAKGVGFGLIGKFGFTQSNIPYNAKIDMITVRARTFTSLVLPTVVNLKVRYYINGLFVSELEQFTGVPSIHVNLPFEFDSLDLTAQQLNTIQVEVESAGSGWDANTRLLIKELDILSQYRVIPDLKSKSFFNLSEVAKMYNISVEPVYHATSDPSKQVSIDGKVIFSNLETRAKQVLVEDE